MTANGTPSCARLTHPLAKLLARSLNSKWAQDRGVRGRRYKGGGCELIAKISPLSESAGASISISNAPTTTTGEEPAMMLG
jgi:hypothetical protein